MKTSFYDKVLHTGDNWKITRAMHGTAALNDWKVWQHDNHVGSINKSSDGYDTSVILWDNTLSDDFGGPITIKYLKDAIQTVKDFMNNQG